jgi:hypothetical protein
MTKKEHSKLFSLPDIARWDENSDVELPAVQRGLVWRPFQIENLWDSLLRGYPIGAFVLSPKNNDRYNLLDGQQRASAICYALGRKLFKYPEGKFKVFIDLDQTPMKDSRKYLFRVITRSHPWGYSKKDNSKTLDSAEIRKAQELCGVPDPLAEGAFEQFFPYDAELPAPLTAFIDTETLCVKSAETVIEWLNNEYKNSWGLIKERWLKSIAHINEINEDKKKKDRELSRLPELSDLKDIPERIKEICSDLKKILDDDGKLMVPALCLDFEKVSHDRNVSSESEGQSYIKDGKSEEATDDNDDIENLFVRLNAGGTPLKAEELNYSILKSVLDTKLTSDIELAVEKLFKPERFITIAYRLYQHTKQREQSEALKMRVKPKQFQKAMKDKKDLKKFTVFLQTFLQLQKTYDSKTLIEFTRNKLEYCPKNNEYGLPHLIVARIADEAPEVMFMLLYRIMFMNDRFNDGNLHRTLHRTMLGMVSLFMWFGKGERQRDYSKLLSNVWPAVTSLEEKLFWSSCTVQRAMLDDILIPFPSYKGKKGLCRLGSIKKLQARSDIFKKFNMLTNTQMYETFVQKIVVERDLVMYAQRKFLTEYFAKGLYYLDDTNMPFDWDHISPQKFIRGHRIPPIIKAWYSTNGNLRAWPYELNRMDHDSVPAKKLDPLNEIWREEPSEEEDTSNPTDRGGDFDRTNKMWDEFILRHQGKLSMDKVNAANKVSKVKECLLEWSACSPKWLECSESEMKERQNWETVYRRIIERNLDICKQWYEHLHIESLIPATSELTLANVFLKCWDNKPWKNKNKKKEYAELKNWIGTEGNTLIYGPVKVNEDTAYVYFWYDEDRKEQLASNAIMFGLYFKDAMRYKETTDTIKAKIKYRYPREKDKWITGNFTLVSHQRASYRKLVKDILGWLDGFSGLNLGKLFIKTFKKTYC